MFHDVTNKKSKAACGVTEKVNCPVLSSTSQPVTEEFSA